MSLYIAAQKMTCSQDPSLMRPLTTQEMLSLVIVVILLTVIKIFLIQGVWNWTIPYMFKSKRLEITFGTAFGLAVLASLLVQVWYDHVIFEKEYKNFLVNMNLLDSLKVESYRFWQQLENIIFILTFSVYYEINI